MKEICIHHHLGLGDHLDLNGMIRYLLKEGDFTKIHIFSKDMYFDMIDFMYRDEERIVVNKIGNDPQTETQEVIDYVNSSSCSEVLRIGHEYYPPNPEKNRNCWEYFYDQVGIPYEIRVDMFYVKRDHTEESRLFDKMNPNNKPFLFFHDDVYKGYEIDKKSFLDSSLLAIGNDKSENIFFFIKLLEQANEIHCMESCFKSLVEFVDTKAELFYHDFRNHSLGKTNKKWTVIDYA